MKSFIALTSWTPSTERATISIGKSDIDTLNGTIFYDGVRIEGKFFGGPFGWLYQHPDGQWGLPGLGHGQHELTVRIVTNGKTSNLVGGIYVGTPMQWGGRYNKDPRFFPNPERLLPLLYAAGFRGEQGLLNPFSIACGESGFYHKIRNWTVNYGYRPAADVIPDPGPVGSWSQNLPRTPGIARQLHSDRGLFQFNSYWHKDVTDAQCDDPAEACKAIFRKSKGGTDWAAWGFDSGAEHYKPFWDAAVSGYPALRPLVQAFLKTK